MGPVGWPEDYEVLCRQCCGQRSLQHHGFSHGEVIVTDPGRTSVRMSPNSTGTAISRPDDITELRKSNYQTPLSAIVVEIIHIK